MNPKERILVWQKAVGDVPRTLVSIRRNQYSPTYYEYRESKVIEKPSTPIEPIEVEIGDIIEPTNVPTPITYPCGPCGKSFKTMPALKAHSTRYHKTDAE